MTSLLGESLHSIDSILERRAEARTSTGARAAIPSDIEAAQSGASAIAPPQNAEPQFDTVSLKKPGTVLLAAGSIIPASLVDELRSDLPGDFRAMVTNDVYGTLQPEQIVIPRGAMILGTYGSRASVGQRRLRVEGIRILFPDGDALDLNGSSGLDANGATGLKGKRRTGFLTAILGTALISGAQNYGRRNSGDNSNSSDLADAARIVTGTAVSNIAESYFGETLARGPTFFEKRGAILNIRLNQDAYLEGATP